METNRCKIDTLKNSDYEKVRQLFMNEKVRQFLGGVVNSESFKESFKTMIVNSSNSYYWIIRLKCDNEIIGLVSLDRHHDGVSTEISYQFMPEYWGYGYAQEVVRKIIDYAFNELFINKIVAETQSANKSSCNLLKKIGMNLEQTILRVKAEQYIFYIEKKSN